MQLTIDSSQPLDDVLRVVGAMFNVTLQVEAGAATPVAQVPTRAAGARRPRQAAGRSAGRRTTTRRGGRGSTADIRRWAIEHGLDVRSRGRIPSTVVSAYRAAHRS